MDIHPEVSSGIPTRDVRSVFDVDLILKYPRLDANTGYGYPTEESIWVMERGYQIHMKSSPLPAIFCQILVSFCHIVLVFVIFRMNAHLAYGIHLKCPLSIRISYTPHRGSQNVIGTFMLDTNLGLKRRLIFRVDSSYMAGMSI